MENVIFYTIVGILLFNYILSRVLEGLNDKFRTDKLPEELAGIYDQEKYSKSQAYDKERGKFSLLTGTISIVAMLAILFLDGFGYLDGIVRTYTKHPVWMALLFFGVLALLSDLLSTPFSWYSTFKIEEKYGFNKTTPGTFIADKIKGYALAGIIGGLLLSVLIWFIESTGSMFWLYAWGALSGFMIFMTMFYATLIVPMFNKLTPLEDGELKTAIESYCEKVGFNLNNLFVLDGSKRSTKANAYFSGLGARKTIVLYDTLIEKNTTEELVAVLAHEIGHYKKKHTRSSIILSLLQTGLMLFIFSFFVNNEFLSKALGAKETSIHLSLLAFSLLYSPLSTILGVLMNMLSRKNEYEADRYARDTYGAKPLMSALKNLSVDSLSNLRPHPYYVFLYYSHPTLLQRLKALAN